MPLSRRISVRVSRGHDAGFRQFGAKTLAGVFPIGTGHDS
jgi:hypothetical protein